MPSPKPRHFWCFPILKYKPQESSKQPPFLHNNSFPRTSISSQNIQNGRRKTQLYPQAPHSWFLRTLLNVSKPFRRHQTQAYPHINSTSKNADDVVITLAIRTPLAKGFKGGFKDTQLDYLVYSLLKKVIDKSKIDPKLVEDICCGNVSLPLTRRPRIL